MGKWREIGEESESVRASLSLRTITLNPCYKENRKTYRKIWKQPKFINFN